MMKRLAIWAILLVSLVGTAQALVGPRRALLSGNPFSWVLAGAAVDLNLATGQYYAGGATTPGAQLSITRASSGYAQNASTGIWTLFGNNTFRIGPGNGLLIEEARTNDALWARDMTQASWVAVGTGTALNATGIDGGANTATTLTATGTAGSCTSSCTILQSITLGSQADTYSVWLKRVTGTGTVNITINNLTGTTACTLTTTAFTRCSVTATLANPVIGIQMTALNDVIIADFNQMEPGGGPTSPILTTSATATRSADSIPLAGAASTNIKSGVFSVRTQTGPVGGAAAGTAFPGTLGYTNVSQYIRYGFGGLDQTHIQAEAQTGAFIINTLLGGSGNFYTSPKIAVVLAVDGTGFLLVGNQGTPASTSAGTFGSTTNVPFLGSDSTLGWINTYMNRLTIWSMRLSSATATSMSATQ